MNLVLRIVSAAILLPIVLFLIHRGGAYMFGLATVVTAICLFEYSGIVAKGDNVVRVVLMVLGTAAGAFAMQHDNPTAALVALQLAGVGIAILYTLRTGDFDSAWTRMSTLAFGLLYCCLGMVSIHELRELGDGLSEWQRPAWLYCALIATWANDTTAYFAGRAFGKHKLYEKVSPKKTWEGFAGGALGSVGFLFAARAVFDNAFAQLSVVDALFIGIPAAALGPIGDLAESLLKRNFGVKDSGNTIPGHGGMLDRVDALFFVAPWTLLYLTAIRPLLGA